MHHPASQITRAIRDGDHARLKELLALRTAGVALVDAGHVSHMTSELPLVYAAKRGDAQAVRMLLEAGAPLESKTDNGDTAIFEAVWIERMAAIQSLEHTNDQGTTPLHFAAAGGNRQWIETLIAKTPYRLTTTNANGYRPQDNCLDAATWHYLRGLAPELAGNERFRNGYDSLFLLCVRGNWGAVQTLIGEGAQTDATYGMSRDTLLHAAAQSGSTETLDVLVCAGCKVIVRNAQNYRPLHRAVQLADEAMVKALLAHGAKPNIKTNSSFIIRETRTPLYFAVDMGHLTIARALLEAGADPNDLCDSSNCTALVEAARNDDLAMARLLVEAGASPNGVNRSKQGVDYFYFPLGNASSGEMVKLLVEAGAQVNARNVHGETALKWIAQAKTPGSREQAALKALLAAGADPHETDMHGMTALSWAESSVMTKLLSAAMREPGPRAKLTGEVAQAEREHADYREAIEGLAGVLTGQAAPTESADDEAIGKALFERAHDVAYDLSRVTDYAALLEGATARDLNYATPDSYYDEETTLHRLCEAVGSAMDDLPVLNALVPVVQKAIALGANVHATKTDGRTPLHALMYFTAYRSWNANAVTLVNALVDALLDAGAPISDCNEQNSSALDEAGHPDVARHLIARGARWSGWPSGCRHALQYEPGWGRVAELIQLGAKINAPHRPGANLLSELAATCSLAEYERLIGWGAAWPKLVDEECSPLGRACDAGNLPLIAKLTQDHADSIDHRCGYRRTALHALALWMRDKADKEQRPAALEAACALVAAGADVYAKDGGGEVALDAFPTKPMRDKLSKLQASRAKA
jgi:ankyrin repeat protein